MRESIGAGSPNIESFNLDERYTVTYGGIWLSGIQALSRLALDQHRLDRHAGIMSAGYISGYRGSPLGSFDRELERISKLRKSANIEFNPGINEDLAATAVWGTQQVNLFSGAKFQGVYGMWYGKAPGLDRSSDAIRHANMAGTSPYGGVLAVVGDDPSCKSSTLPSSSFGLLSELGMPSLDPSDVRDVIEFGLYGWALSRFTGLWTGMVAQTAVMDSTATLSVDLNKYLWSQPPSSVDPHIRLNDTPHDQEARLFEKLSLVDLFAQRNSIDKVFGSEGEANVAIVSSGVTFNKTKEALELLGFHPQALKRAGIRLVKLGMVWPLNGNRIHGFIAGSHKVVVVENKRPILEAQIRACLCGRGDYQIVGKRMLHDEILFSSIGELSVADIAKGLKRSLAGYDLEVPSNEYLERLRRFTPNLLAERESPSLGRKPLYCPGCPHSISTKVPEGSRALAGIGCHYMVQWMDRNTHTFTHMGGEGVNWVGQEPFTDESHVFVNLGDGTYFHSGLLAIRAAVVSGVNVTYKILFNDAVAMTGGQSLEGNLSVHDIVRQVRAENVAAVHVVADDVRKHANADFDVSPRKKLDKVQRELRTVEGCTVLIYDQACSNELRRKRKRGLASVSKTHIVINEDVCEGCGDCSAKSACSAIEPLPTEFGLKRQIDLTRCNQDLTCLEGYCPAMVEVEGELKTPTIEVTDKETLPNVVTPASGNILIAGVGGTGVVTVSQILAVAAHTEGKQVSTLDMTGLAQKGGAVISHVRIHPDHVNRTCIADREADVLIGADIVTAAMLSTRNMVAADRTCGVINSHVQPTAEFVLNFTHDASSNNDLNTLRKSLKSSQMVDAEHHAKNLTGSSMGANIFLLGFAWQHGLVPLSAESIEQAIVLNKAGVKENLVVFRAGRQACVDQTKPAISNSNVSQYPPKDQCIREFLVIRKKRLTEYGDEARVRELKIEFKQMRQAECRVDVESERLTRLATDNHFRFLAPKDEYEVARLLTKRSFTDTLDTLFESGYELTHAFAPSWLPFQDRNRKIKVGVWIRPLLRVLKMFKVLRGNLLDPFRWSSERALDRTLLESFRRDSSLIAANLDSTNFSHAVEIQMLYSEVLGYGHVRSGNWDRVKPEIDAIIAKHFRLTTRQKAA